MIDRQQLLKDLQRELSKVEKDILTYSEQSAERTAHLKQEYTKAKEAGRTAEHFVSWREAQITQAAVAWVLTCVFVRFLEDNGLLAQPVLSGPVQLEDGQSTGKSNPLKNAKDRIEAYFNEHTTHAEREYLLHLFEQLEQIPVIAELLDHSHNPLWQIPVSADGAKSLIDFFQKINPETGQIIHDFTDHNWDTRFLGDLYQDLSEAVRKRYALLQTPEFVESFILDYTLEPAIDTFGLEGLRLIDPTCGSGHFLLTTFERIFERWQKREPGTNSRVLVQRALDVVHGVDINPYAVAICRFRLLMAAMKSCDIELVKDAPAFQFNLACGDSLLHGRKFEWQGQGIQQGLLGDELSHFFEVEDIEKLNKILGQQYQVVVGNPPYITIPDKSLKAAVKNRYSTCYGKYTLSVPFIERFFDLSNSGKVAHSPGYIGMINSNAFMKREFGKPLIEKYLINKDITHIVDTSGANIPGHPTPTFILFARNQEPNLPTIRGVLGNAGDEGSCNEDDSVWSSIKKYICSPEHEDKFISVTDLPRILLAKHPWSIGGGGVTELTEDIENGMIVRLKAQAESIGISSVMGEDDVYLIGSNRNAKRLNIEFTRDMVTGDAVRNWSICSEPAIWLYDDNFDLVDLFKFGGLYTYMWPYRTKLAKRKQFGTPMLEKGLTWYEYQELYSRKLESCLLISFAFVSTHNHFSLNRSPRTFKQTAPIIKLKNDPKIESYLELIGFLNSSVICFWLKQKCFDKGGPGTWQRRFEFDSTKLKNTPIPDPKKNPFIVEAATAVSTAIDHLVNLHDEISAESIVKNYSERDAIIKALDAADKSRIHIQRRLVYLQEEMDWISYEAYGLTSKKLWNQDENIEVDPGQRAFEFILARCGEGEDWFVEHGIVKRTETDELWSDKYKCLVRERIEEIKNNKQIGMIEKPEYKRRWKFTVWEEEIKKAIKQSILGFIEDKMESLDSCSLLRCSDISEICANDGAIRALAQIYSGNELFDMQIFVEELVASESVPQMALARLKDSAIKIYRAWQETWERQRQEDAIDAEFGVDKPLSDVADESECAKYGEAKRKAEAKKAEIVGDISVPPQYKQGDFRKASYWLLRGKLDVPKERFFSLPDCEKDGDSTLVVGWAGLNHLQRAQAIAAWYEDRKENDGWEAQRLMPMLVALDELIPWLQQWHNDIDPEYGERMGDFYESYLLEELRRWELTREELFNWRPPATTRRRRA